MKQNNPSYLSAAASDRPAVPSDVALTIGGEAIEGVNPPLVSFVLVNWNYAAYVGQTIDSIVAQNYPHFECLVIDNGSTDASRDVIARHIRGDGRFRLISLNENKGQLGGALIALKEIKGSFVVFVDSDDLLFPNFVSSHLQVHLSVFRDVAITSNHVIEIDGSGSALGSYAGNLPLERNEGSSEFRHPDSTPRLSTIDDAAHAQLSAATRIISEAGPTSWIWGPGTANMIRRSVLNLFTSDQDGAVFMRATDNYVFPLSHAIAGSAIIGVPLSAYRIHGKNYCTRNKTFKDLNNVNPFFMQTSKPDMLQNLDGFLAAVEQTGPLLGGKFWRALDGAFPSSQPRTIRDLYRSPDAVGIFERHAGCLRSQAGDKSFVRNIHARVGFRPAVQIMRSAYDGKVPGKAWAHLLRSVCQPWRRRAYFKH
jgi:glycosyltransferase involved in cell wall biosynthesis